MCVRIFSGNGLMPSISFRCNKQGIDIAARCETLTRNQKETFSTLLAIYVENSAF